MIVVDASSVIAALEDDGAARALLGTESLHAPHLIDSEVAGVVRRRALAGALTPAAGREMLLAWQLIGIRRHPGHPFLERIWELRDSLTAYDATYVALAESLGCPLLTRDRRLARAPGIGCSVMLVPD